MPESRVLLDTGPLVALLIENDEYHPWVVQQFDQLAPPLLTCEAVVCEAAYLVSRVPSGSRRFTQLIERELLRVDFRLWPERQAIGELMARYANVPMSLADACLVRMVELNPGVRIMTLDSDFRVYRQHRRRIIPVIMPPGR